MKKKSIISTLIIPLILLILYLYDDSLFKPTTSEVEDDSVAFTLIVPSERFPETAAHIKAAIERGKSAICTIDREGAEENRKESLRGIPTKPNYDRDEFPMAMCAEGGKGADIEYVSPSDNRGAGSWVSNQLEKYPNGTKVLIKVG